MMRARREHCAALVMALALVGQAAAEPSRAPGSNTGDGSTPFTGLARAPEANLFVGGATTSIPIEVPPGRKGLTPKVSLIYSSSSGPSPYGFGWDLPLGQIQRSTRHGVLSCSDPTYRNDFVLVLPGATVECTLDENTDSCDATVEESFIRIRYRGANNSWEVWDKSGMHYVFGELNTARVGSGSDLFASAYPCTYTFSWALDRIEDPNGNYLQISYLKQDGVLYPDSIRYGGNVRTGLAHSFEVKFGWGPRSPEDEIVTGLGGFAARLTNLLWEVDVRYLVTNRLIRWYSFDYDYATIGRQSHLNAVTLYDDKDHALARRDGLPAQTTFLYQDNTPARFGFGPEPQRASVPQLAGYFVPGRIVDRTHTFRDIFDIDGDGIPDLIDDTDCDVTGYWTVFLGSPKGFAATPIQWQLPTQASCWIRVVDDDSRTVSDTLDINGDGIPDLVSAATAPWTVYLGYAGGFDPNPTTWSAPLPYLRRSVSNVTITNGARGTIDVQDLLDMNGDGLLDLVSAPGTGLQWRVWYNTGSGFEPGSGEVFDTPASASFLRFTDQRSGAQMIGVHDMNGDGLPDHIIAYATAPNVWYVFPNIGHAMSDTPQTWTPPAMSCGRQGLQAPLSLTERSVVRDLFDINGDGLPDLVDVCGWSDGDRSWQVVLNAGAGFSPSAHRWPSQGSVIRNIGDTVYGTTLTYSDTFDLDGDGLVDFVDFAAADDAILVYHNTGGAWCPSTDGSTCTDTPGGDNVAATLQATRPDLLQQIENGIGGTTHLEYRPSTQWRNTKPDGSPSLPFVMWTLTHIEQDDGLCDDSGTVCASAGSHTLTKDLRYAFGLYEPGAREFRGFGTVEQYDSDGNLLTTWFGQDAARKGKVYAASAYAADGDTPHSKLLVYTLNFWECADTETGQVLECPQSLAAGQRPWVRLRETDRYDTRNYTISKVAFNQNAGWDAYGNVTHAVRGGTGTTSVHMYTSYAVRNDAFAYIADRPTHTLTVDDAVREEKWFTYDNLGGGQVSQGNVTAVSTWLDQVVDPHLPAGDSCPQSPSTGAGTCITMQMGYDPLGNLIVATDAAGRSTVTTYDDSTQIYPYTVTNALHQEVATLYDPACGKLLWQTVAYPAGEDPTVQARIEHRYDTFCRLDATALPDELLARPHRIFHYLLGAPGHATEVQIVEAVAGTAPRPARRVTRHELFDALGRHLQTHRDGVVNGRRATVVEGTATFDARGNPAIRYAPFLKAGLQKLAAAPYIQPPGGTGFTTFSYDPLDRVTEIINADGSLRRMEHNVAWQTTTKDECYNSQTCPGSQLVEKRDAFGRVIEKQAYSGDTFQARTGYTYDGLGRLLTTTQGTSLTDWVTQTTISLTYDSLGRKIQMSDPDSGTWRYGYDLVGNLIFQDDPKTNQHSEFCYDALNRLTDKLHYTNRDGFGPTHCGTVRGDIAYNYDETLSTRCPSNSCPTGNCGLGRLTSIAERSGGSTTLCYDTRGRTASVITGISASGLTSVGQTSFAYDVADHVVSMTYPDGERVKYEYDAVGQVKGLRGTQGYLRNLTYDIFGRPRILTHANRTTDTLTYYDQNSNFRLAAIETRKGNTPLLSYAYTGYRPAGLLTQLTDNSPKGLNSGLDNTATFTYDALARLTGVEGPNLPYANGYAYDALGNVNMKEGTTFTYSATQPHRLVGINGSSAGIAHDANGNRTAKPGHTYEYDAEDRLIGINVGNAATVSFVYDYAGHRVAKIKGGSVTRYYGPWVEAGDGFLTKYYFAAGLLIASQRIANTDLSGLPPDPAVQLAGDPGQHALRLQVLLRPDVGAGVGLIAGVGLLALLSVPGRRKPVVGIAMRRGPIIVLIVAFSLVSFPLPITVRPARAYQKGIVMHYHLDHLGSTQLITDSRGAVVAHIRYKPYGEVRGYYAPDGSVLAPDACGGAPSCREFTGYDTEPVSGLQYAGARFYDPALGMFLTHDPGRQFANPYSYGNGDPVNWTDPNGEFFFEFLAAVLIAALLSSAVSVVIAAAQGASLNQIGKAAAAGAIGGAVGVGLGVLVSGIGMGMSALAGTLPQNVTLNEALNALSEVAYRSAFSTIAANAAGQTAAAAGAPSGLTIGLSAAAGYAASYEFDQTWLDPLGDLAKIESKGAFQQAGTTATHTDVTTKAAEVAGFDQSETEVILKNNLAQDLELANNQGHFGYGARDAFERFAKAAVEGKDLRYVGAASHYIQDQYALGHIFPGTNFLAGPLGAPFRFLIHQTVGGEVNFFRITAGLRIPSSFDATFDYFSAARRYIPAGMAL